jgi:hypothetical protein
LLELFDGQMGGNNRKKKELGLVLE